MASWSYRARDARGELQTGAIAAPDAPGALRQLEARGLAVTALHSADPASDAPAAHPAQAKRLAARPRRVRPRDRIQLLEELATLLGAGVSLGEAAPSLEAAYAGTALAGPVQAVRRTVQAGEPLGVALRRCGIGLPEGVFALIESGEAAGRLSASLHDAARQMDYERQVAEDFTGALIYPAILVGAGLVCVLGIFIIVVPRFATLLGGRAQIPAISRWVIEGGLWFQQHWLAAVLGLALVVAGVIMALRRPGARAAALAGLARLPAVGPWLHEAEVGRWATTLGTLLGNRVPMVEALALASQAARLASDRARMARVADDVRRGRPLSEALGEHAWVAPTRLNLLRVGERSGDLPRLLGELGRISTEAARLRMKRLLALIEPLAIIVIGGVIGFIMVAVILAITSLNSVKF